MHLVDEMDLPAPYSARPYVGAADHPAIVAVLEAHRSESGLDEMPTVEQLDLTYANLRDCDPQVDIAIVEARGEVVAYCRASFEDLASGGRDLVVFTPTLPEHLHEELVTALVLANERHMLRWRLDDTDLRYRAFAGHPGPGQVAAGESAWLEALGYEATEWGAFLVRPHLDDIPERTLPDGVEVRPVTEDQLRTILDADFEAFRGEWDFREPTEEDYVEAIESPLRDTTLWKVAWAGETVVGQVKPFINHEENDERGYRRGYTEFISTHRNWRNRGVAGALLSMALCEVRDRGMTEAALSVDTNNPGGAFQLYTSLGFELRSYEAVYTRAVPHA
ncbi:MAG TPA: GNAT family N-acetyltransferase [Ilumatobacteraceae bacterium]|nr:GNAT family N-acetyltransferase [Ilumatobacteraceae bacterium]